MINEMIRLEASASPNWALINEIGGNALRIIVDNGMEKDLDGYIIKYLDDADIREKDSDYGDYQRKVVTEIVSDIGFT